MCNEAARRVALGQIREDFAELRIPLRFPEGLPNLAAADSVRITDVSPIIRAASSSEQSHGEDGPAELVMRRWSWPLPNGRPLYNFRSEGRRFGNNRDGGRCLIPLDAFYEFTEAAGATTKRKDKWAFSLSNRTDGQANPFASVGRPNAFFCVAGLWRRDATVGEAFTMLTAEPGPDVAPFHSRQIVLLPITVWRDWIDGTVPAETLTQPTPAGTLRVDKVER